jgi:hypothetical protein
VSVLVLDERAQPGGQYYKQVATTGTAAPDAQHPAGARLIAAALGLGVDIRSALGGLLRFEHRSPAEA